MVVLSHWIIFRAFQREAGTEGTGGTVVACWNLAFWTPYQDDLIQPLKVKLWIRTSLAMVSLSPRSFPSWFFCASSGCRLQRCLGRGVQNKVKIPRWIKASVSLGVQHPRNRGFRPSCFLREELKQVGFREWEGSESTRAQSKDPNIKQPVFKTQHFSSAIFF